MRGHMLDSTSLRIYSPSMQGPGGLDLLKCGREMHGSMGNVVQTGDCREGGRRELTACDVTASRSEEASGRKMMTSGRFAAGTMMTEMIAIFNPRLSLARSLRSSLGLCGNVMELVPPVGGASRLRSREAAPVNDVFSWWPCLGGGSADVGESIFRRGGAT